MGLKIFFKNASVSIVVFISLFFVISVYAVPKEIILIRHADKLDQANPGPFLSPAGLVRAQHFSTYYLGHFHEPDFIITTAHTHSSNRELQTVMPLVTQFALRHPNGGQPILMSDEYKHDKDKKNKSKLQKLYTDLLNDPQFNDKIILICWHHGEIPALLDGLGVTPHQHKLADDNYDTVYDITFDKLQGVIKLAVLSNQYPVLLEKK